MQTFGNRFHYNNIIGNTNYGIEGVLCFDNAKNNYWGHPPIRALFNNGEGDIYTPGGIVAIWPYRTIPVDIDIEIKE